MTILGRHNTSTGLKCGLDSVWAIHPSLRVKRSNPDRSSLLFLWIVTSLALLAMTFATLPAHAACTNPEGDEGEQVFNSLHSVMQFCDGTNWVRMDGFGAGKWVQGTGFLYRERGAVAVGTNTVPADTMLAVSGRARVDSLQVQGQDKPTTNFITDLSRVPAVTTMERNALTPSTGLMVLNTDTNQIEVYIGASWVVIGGTQNTWLGTGGDGYELYNFTSHIFTNCGVSGRDGPTLSDCRAAYSTPWDENDEFYYMTTLGYQLWRPPVAGTYRIRAAGARGGYGFNGSAYTGDGRIVEGTVELDPSEMIIIAVGQMGQDRLIDYYGGGGGGGTFIARGANQATAEILMVAGGGGASNAYTRYGWLGRYGGNGHGYPSNFGDVVRDWANYRGSGASITGEGIDYNNNPHHRAKPFRQNLRGGQKTDCYLTWGGFGGGGTPHCHNGAGGGGYHGGAAGHDHRYSGEGGGSYINPSFLTSNMDAGLNHNHGFVEVELLP